MSYHILQNSKSILAEGIETIHIQVTDQYDMDCIVREKERGGRHAVVEWLLKELYRQMEIDRVCGMDTSPMMGGFVISLQLRQPGRQLEEWMRQHPVLTIHRLDQGACAVEIGRGELLGYLSARSMENVKFRDTNPPYWAKEQHDSDPAGKPDSVHLSEGGS